MHTPWQGYCETRIWVITWNNLPPQMGLRQMMHLQSGTCSSRTEGTIGSHLECLSVRYSGQSDVGTDQHGEAEQTLPGAELTASGIAALYDGEGLAEWIEVRQGIEQRRRLTRSVMQTAPHRLVGQRTTLLIHAFERIVVDRIAIAVTVGSASTHPRSRRRDELSQSRLIRSPAAAALVYLPTRKRV